MKLSIIVPVYKVEKYLSACLTSLVHQDIAASDYEIIVVNDGSPDNSKTIILSFQEKYSNIIAIDQENQGVSVARNNALKIAKGDYITFVDADDLIYENSLKTILNKLFDDNLCLLYASIDRVDEQGKYNDSFAKMTQNNEVLSGFEHPRRTFPPTFYKKSILNGIKFIPNIVVGEDTVFNAMVQTNAIRCTFLSSPYYCYRMRQESASRAVKNHKIFEGFVTAIKSINNFRNDNFPKATSSQNLYFNGVLKIFISRSIDWFVLPKMRKFYFLALKKALVNNHLDYLINETALNYKMFNNSFPIFYAYTTIRRMYHALNNAKN